MPATYEPIATTTFAGSSSEVTFSSIASSWTDLRLVFVGTSSSSQGLAIQFNADTGTNYSRTGLQGDGSTASSFRNTSLDRIVVASVGTTPVYAGVDIFSYSGSTNKTTLSEESRDLNGSGNVVRCVGLWRNTSAITSLRLYGFSGVALTGTATLYGIKNA